MWTKCAIINFMTCITIIITDYYGGRRLLAGKKEMKMAKIFFLFLMKSKKEIQ
jgi:hypothetical protein